MELYIHVNYTTVYIPYDSALLELIMVERN